MHSQAEVIENGEVLLKISGIGKGRMKPSHLF